MPAFGHLAPTRTVWCVAKHKPHLLPRAPHVMPACRLAWWHAHTMLRTSPSSHHDLSTCDHAIHSHTLQKQVSLSYGSSQLSEAGLQSTGNTSTLTFSSEHGSAVLLLNTSWSAAWTAGSSCNNVFTNSRPLFPLLAVLPAAEPPQPQGNPGASSTWAVSSGTRMRNLCCISDVASQADAYLPSAGQACRSK